MGKMRDRRRRGASSSKTVKGGGGRTEVIRSVPVFNLGMIK